MLSFIIRRLLLVIPMALLVVTVTWGLIRLAPGSFYSGEKTLPPAIEANIKKKYGLDKPWYQQYGLMLWNTVHLDFGASLKYPGPQRQSDHRRPFPVFGNHRISRLYSGIDSRSGGGNHCRAQTKFGVRLCFDGTGDGRSVRAEFRSRSDYGSVFCARTLRFAAGAVGRNYVFDNAGHHAFGNLHGIYRASDTRRNARSNALGLYPHGAGKRFERKDSFAQTRSARRNYSGRFVYRSRACRDFLPERSSSKKCLQFPDSAIFLFNRF